MQVMEPLNHSIGWIYYTLRIVTQSEVLCFIKASYHPINLVIQSYNTQYYRKKSFYTSLTKRSMSSWVSSQAPILIEKKYRKFCVFANTTSCVLKNQLWELSLKHSDKLVLNSMSTNLE